MDGDFSLTDLTRLTGIAPRTIRSYIEKGLLPGADSRGPKSHYTDNHLRRLQVITRLRNARRETTLEELRLLLQQLSPVTIAGIADGTIQIGALIDVKDSTLKPLDTPVAKTDVQARWSQGNRLVELVHVLRPLTRHTSLPPKSKRKGWCRIEITPDVELHVSSRLSDDTLATFEELCDQLREALNTGLPSGTQNS